jgi:hypothetical protein
MGTLTVSPLIPYDIASFLLGFQYVETSGFSSLFKIQDLADWLRPFQIHRWLHHALVRHLLRVLQDRDPSSMNADPIQTGDADRRAE